MAKRCWLEEYKKIERTRSGFYVANKKAKKKSGSLWDDERMSSSGWEHMVGYGLKGKAAFAHVKIIKMLYNRGVFLLKKFQFQIWAMQIRHNCTFKTRLHGLRSYDHLAMNWTKDTAKGQPLDSNWWPLIVDVGLETPTECMICRELFNGNMGRVGAPPVCWLAGLDLAFKKR